jgi:hypothetical protein
VRPAEADGAAVGGDGEPGELGDPGCVVLGDVEPGDVELRDELADAELGVDDPEAARDVTVNCSMAMGALPLAAG